MRSIVVVLFGQDHGGGRKNDRPVAEVDDLGHLSPAPQTWKRNQLEDYRPCERRRPLSLCVILPVLDSLVFLKPQPS